MVAVSDKSTSHITLVFDVMTFSRSERSRFKTNYEVGMSLLLFHLECLTSCEHPGNLYIYAHFRPNWTSNIWLPGGHLGKSTKSYYSWTNGQIFSKRYCYRREYLGFKCDLLLKAAEVVAQNGTVYWDVLLLLDLQCFFTPCVNIFFSVPSIFTLVLTKILFR
jgi:hypothetical protein